MSAEEEALKLLAIMSSVPTTITTSSSSCIPSSSSMKTTNLTKVMEIQSQAAAFRAARNMDSQTQTDFMYCSNCCIMAYPDIKKTRFISDDDLQKNALQQSLLELSVCSNIANTTSNLYFDSVFIRVYSPI